MLLQPRGESDGYLRDKNRTQTNAANGLKSSKVLVDSATDIWVSNMQLTALIPPELSNSVSLPCRLKSAFYAKLNVGIC